MKKLFTKLTSMVLAIMMLTACGGSSDSQTDSEEGAGLVGGSTTSSLNVSMRADITNLDPQGHTDLYSFLADAQIFDTLIYMDENGEFQNLLAESLEQSEDATTMRVTIKQGVMFSNGEELKASDVKFSFERGVASTTFGRISAVDHVDVIDDYTVDIVFVDPTAYMEMPLSAIFIVNEAEVTRVGDDFGNSIDGVIGTGAYEITSWEKGQSLTFVRNDDYWQGAADIENISIKIIADQSTAAIALQKGEIDYIFEADASLDRTLSEDENITTHSAMQNANMFIMLNCGQAPFDDLNLRTAVAYAINRDDISTVSTDGHGIPTGYFVLDTMLGQAEGMTLPDQDIELAKEYMAKSAYADGVTVTFITNDTETEKIATVVQAQLAEIGITVELQAMEFGAALDLYFAGDYEMSSTGFINMINPDHYYKYMHSESGISFFWYTNDELDDLLLAGRTEIDEETRNEIYAQAQEIMRDEVIYIPLYAVQQYAFTNKDLGGVKIFPIMTPQFRELYWN